MPDAPVPVQFNQGDQLKAWCVRPRMVPRGVRLVRAISRQVSPPSIRRRTVCRIVSGNSRIARCTSSYRSLAMTCPAGSSDGIDTVYFALHFHRHESSRPRGADLVQRDPVDDLEPPSSELLLSTILGQRINGLDPRLLCDILGWHPARYDKARKVKRQTMVGLLAWRHFAIEAPGEQHMIRLGSSRLSHGTTGLPLKRWWQTPCTGPETQRRTPSLR